MEHLFRAELSGDSDGDFPGQLGHAVEEPARHLAIVQRQIGDSSSLWRVGHLLIRLCIYYTRFVPSPLMGED